MSLQSDSEFQTYGYVGLLVENREFFIGAYPQRCREGAMVRISS